MKMLYIVDTGIPTKKAHGFQICKMCEEFSRQEVEIELWIPKNKKNKEIDIFSYYGIQRLFAVRYIKNICSNILVKYSELLSFYLEKITFFLSLFFKRIDKKTFVYTRSPQIAWLFTIKKRFVVYEAHSWPKSKHGLYTFFLRKVNLIVCNSNGTCNEYLKRGLKNAIVAPNGVDLKEFDDKKNKQVCKKELGLDMHKRIVMYVGHLYKWKGVDLLLDAAKYIKDQNIQFVIVGGFPHDIKNYNDAIKKKNLSNISLVGYVNKVLIPKYLKAADMLVLPNVSISEESIKHTSPIKMFEYMASKRPIVASNLPSIREILDDKNAFLFKSGSIDDLVKSIELVLTKPEFGAKVADQAYEDVQKFTWGRRCERIIKQMHELV